MKSKMRMIVSLLIMASFLMACAQKQKTKCGKWRWDVKTLTDSNGSNLLLKAPIQMSIDELVNEIPPRVLYSENHIDAQSPRFASENLVVEIIAYVTAVKHQDDDSDLHFILASPDSENTMVGEIPDPSCPTFDNFPELRDHFTKTRRDGMIVWKILKRDNRSVKVKITGVPFWDGKHSNKPRGASEHFREIHPVLKIEILN
jgi:hypothetical protein